MRTSKRAIRELALYCNNHFLYYARHELTDFSNPTIMWRDADSGEWETREFKTNNELREVMLEEYMDLDAHLDKNAA